MAARRADATLSRALEASLRNAGADLVGFADLTDSHSPGQPALTTGVALAIALDRAIVARGDADVAALHLNYHSGYLRMSALVSACQEMLTGYGFAAWAPEVTRNLPGLVGAFSHKLVATRAGLGWVGRSSLLVTFRYGCAVVLGSVLTDAALMHGRPVTESHCGPCTRCVTACPYGAIRGPEWHPGVERDCLLDAYLCSRKREESVAELGFKHPCGLCMRACPVGGEA